MLLKIIQLLSIGLSLTISGFASADSMSQEWIKSQSKYLTSIESLENTPSASELDQALANKRILMLGEPDHYITEKLKYQLALIKRYQAKGFTTIGAEMGRSDARRINQFLQTGDESVLKSVALFGNKTELLIDRDLPKGLLGGSQDAETTAQKQKWIDANLEFWRQLRTLNLSRGKNEKPLELFGFDIDVFPGGGYSDIEKLLGDYTTVEIGKMKFLLRRVPYESRKDEIARLKQAESYVIAEHTAFSRIYPQETLKDITASIRQLIESLEFIDVAYENPDSQQWLEISRKREKTMMWQMDQRLSNPGKIILIGHNSHLSKDSSTLNLLSAASGHFFPMWFTIGTYLQRKLKKQVYTVWMLYGGGSRSSGPECPTPECEIEIKDGTINELLLNASEQKPFLLNLSNKVLPVFLRQAVDIQFNGSNINSSVLTNQCDSILFVPKVHPTEKF